MSKKFKAPKGKMEPYTKTNVILACVAAGLAIIAAVLIFVDFTPEKEKESGSVVTLGMTEATESEEPMTEPADDISEAESEPREESPSTNDEDEQMVEQNTPAATENNDPVYVPNTGNADTEDSYADTETEDTEEDVTEPDSSDPDTDEPTADTSVEPEPEPETETEAVSDVPVETEIIAEPENVE